MLVNKTLELKICDLGFARTTATIGPNDVGLSREAVTQYWRAPEVELSVGGYTKAIGAYRMWMNEGGRSVLVVVWWLTFHFGLDQTCGRWA